MASISKTTTGIRERDVRRRLRERGWSLHPLHRYATCCPDGQVYVVSDDRWNLAIFGQPTGAPLDTIEAWLTRLP